MSRRSAIHRPYRQPSNTLRDRTTANNNTYTYDKQCTVKRTIKIILTVSILTLLLIVTSSGGWVLLNLEVACLKLFKQCVILVIFYDNAGYEPVFPYFANLRKRHGHGYEVITITLYLYGTTQ